MHMLCMCSVCDNVFWMVWLMRASCYMSNITCINVRSSETPGCPLWAAAGLCQDRDSSGTDCASLSKPNGRSFPSSSTCRLTRRETAGKPWHVCLRGSKQMACRHTSTVRGLISSSTGDNSTPFIFCWPLSVIALLTMCMAEREKRRNPPSWGDLAVDEKEHCYFFSNWKKRPSDAAATETFSFCSLHPMFPLLIHHYI